MWQIVAGVGLSALGGFFSGKKAKYEYQATDAINEARTNAANRLRTAQNEAGRAQGSLADYMRSVSNSNLVRAAGEEYNALSTNMGRLADQQVSGSLMSRVQASEQQGALFASAAAAGIGGSTVDMINGTMRIQDAIMREETDRSYGQMTYDMLSQRAGVMDNAYNSWDYTMSADGADLMPTFKPYTAKPSVTQHVLQSTLSNLAGGAGTGMLGQAGQLFNAWGTSGNAPSFSTAIQSFFKG